MFVAGFYASLLENFFILYQFMQIYVDLIWSKLAIFLWSTYLANAWNWETLFDLIETSGQGTQMLCGPDLKRVLTSNE